MITIQPSHYIKLTPGDPGFRLRDGVRVVPRAGIEIAEHCPDAVADMVARALTQGWIRPVAWVHQHDHLMDQLKQ